MSKLIKFDGTIRVPDEKGEWAVDALRDTMDLTLNAAAKQFDGYLLEHKVTVKDETADDLRALYMELDK